MRRCIAAGLVAVVTAEPALDADLGAQRDYLSASLPHVPAKACDHAAAFCKLAVEGCGFYLQNRRGSCVGLGLRIISGGSAVRVAVQALSTGQLSAHINIDANLEVRKVIGVADRVLDRLAFLDRGLGSSARALRHGWPYPEPARRVARR